MDTLRMTNYIIAVVFFVCYTYQFLYIPVPWLLAKRKAAQGGGAGGHAPTTTPC